MYNPNFNDPRVAARTYSALGFAIGTMSTTKPHQWSTRYIDKYFGSQRNDISAWLREVLLITHNNHWNKDTGQCKSYLLNELGVDYLRAVLQKQTSATYAEYAKSVTDDKKNNLSTLYPIVVEVEKRATFDRQAVLNWARREFGAELATLSFNYKDQSDRLWHPLQNIKSEYRQELFADAKFNYQYDIECCAPTLIMQHAQQLGMDEYPFAITQYIRDRQAVRNELAELADVPVKIIKVAINALFCGARLGNNKDFALSELLAHDPARIAVLQQNEFVVQLKSDIKKCWQAIQPTMSRTTVLNPKTNKQKLKPISSKEKWVRYFNLERQVLDITRRYLDETNNKYFLEHDGWMTEREVDQVELLAYIKNASGFSIKIECEQLCVR